MNEAYGLILIQLKGLWRRRWYCVAIAWVVSVAGWVWVAQLPDVYRSSARVYVDTDTMLGPLLEGLAVGPNVFEQVSIMQRTILSRPNLEKVSRMTDLDLTAQTSAEMERLIESLQRDITVGASGSNLFTISYESSEPVLAKRVVQSLLTIFVEGNLGASRKDMDQARRFIANQIAAYAAKLDEAEKERAEFKQRNAGLMSGEGGYFANLEAERKRLEELEGALRDTISKRDVLHEQLALVPQFFDSSDASSLFGPDAGFGGPPSDLEFRINELEGAINSMLFQYTERHPDVIIAQKRLERLRREKEEEDAAWVTSRDSEGEGPGYELPTVKSSNPVYEKLKVILVDQESIIAILKNRIAQQRVKIENLEKRIDTIPVVELELAKLDRDYGIIKHNYEELLSRREATSIAQDLETEANKVEFRIIDPPTLPISPAGPNRLLLFSMVLAGGIGAGIAFGFVLSQIDDSFSSLSGLRERFAFPVLGTISIVMSPARRRVRMMELSTFVMACLGLLGLYGGVVAVGVFELINIA